jgi:DNA-directed RNA polymerase specialized sigma24 family protein
LLVTHLPLVERVTAVIARRCRLPQARAHRHFVGEEALAHVADAALRADRGVDAREAAATMAHASQALASAVAALSPIDRMILCLRFRDGLTLSTIGRALLLDEKLLYRNFARLLRSLRDRLEGDGLSRSDVLEALATEAFELPTMLDADAAT